jgi:hypothetical protein
VPSLEQKGEELATTLNQFAEETKAKMEEVGEASLEAAKDALTQCLGQYTETIDSIMELGDSLQKLLEALMEVVDASGKVVGETKEMVELGVNTTSVGLQAAIGTLDELREFFGRFSFL